MRTLKDFNLKNKKVLLRVDFNVPVGEDGRVDGKEDWRLEASLPTIEYLLKQAAQVILISHLGRPGGEVVEKLRLNPVAQRLEELLKRPVFKSDDLSCPSPEESQLVLLENLRFYKGEKKNSADFAKQLAALADFFVNDAFGTIHRPHASIVGLPKCLKSCSGFLLAKEVEMLSKVLDKPEHPLTVIIGGGKISTKIKMLANFLGRADSLLVAGALANTVISAKGFAIGRSVTRGDMVAEVKKLELTNNKLHIPVDVIASVRPDGRANSRVVPVGRTNPEEMILDIGPDTIQLFKQIISTAKTIVWNGPMGVFEVDKFAQGSRQIAEAIAANQNFSLIGGGDTIVLLEKMNLLKKIDHVSTGGGAMLKFLSGQKLPGLEALDYYELANQT